MGRFTLALSLLLVVGCARLEPPAPIVDRSHESASFTRTATGLLTRLVSFARPEADVSVSPIKAEPGQQLAAAFPPKPKTESYTVKRGDTVHKIARTQAVTTQSIIGANQLKAPYMLRVGQRLTIPAGNRHIIAKGDTLYSVSRRYDVGMRQLAKLNDLHLPYRLNVGQSLALPKIESDNSLALASKLPQGTATQTQTAAIPFPRLRPAAMKLARGPKPRIRPNVPSRVAAASTRVIGSPPPRSGDGFAWPVKGKLLTQFGPLESGRRNEGLNIGAPRGTPVHAAENGIVAYAGNEIRGFGNLILVKHAGGMITAYAHAEALLVRRGDVVKRGQIIARVGTTGGVAAPQLHFEIRRGANAVNPVELLSS